MDTLGVAPRRLGTVLLVLGIVGVLLAGIVALGLIGGAYAARNLDDRFQADQARVGAALDRLTTVVGSVQAGATNASVTLATASETVGDAGILSDELAAISDGLAQALEIDILGSRPFSGVSPRFRDLGDRARLLGQDARDLAEDLATNSGDVSSLAVDIGTIETQVAELADRVSDFDRTDEIVGLLTGAILLGGLLVAWLAVAAGLCAWIGWRLRNAPAKKTTS
jgi:hypothetical protein